MKNPVLLNRICLSGATLDYIAGLSNNSKKSLWLHRHIMTQTERRAYLIKRLCFEKGQEVNFDISANVEQQKRLLRSLMNIRPPGPVPEDILAVQDEYLQLELAERGIVDIDDLTPFADNLFLWQGDITRLRCDAIVNAANSGMTGCYVPCHACIDNCIHTYAGMQMRLECAEIMLRQAAEEKPGCAKLTRAYNLPCKFVIHTVGPIIKDEPTAFDKELLASCYASCMTLAQLHDIKSLAFCCISTGVFNFPAGLAAEIAVRTVWRLSAGKDLKVIFNVFKDSDYEIYRKIIGKAWDAAACS